MIAAGARTAEARADLIDLNFGCPAKEVIGAACGSALMRDLDAAERLIAAAVEATSRPVTVKMRLGWDAASRNAPELAARAERIGAAAVSVHGRTRQQFYTGQADWSAVAEVRSATRLPLVVNGDIIDLKTAQAALQASGADTLMIGRGVYGRPWCAAALDAALAGGSPLAEPEAEAVAYPTNPLAAMRELQELDALPPARPKRLNRRHQAPLPRYRKRWLLVAELGRATASEEALGGESAYAAADHGRAPKKRKRPADPEEKEKIRWNRRFFRCSRGRTRRTSRRGRLQ